MVFSLQSMIGWIGHAATSHILCHSASVGRNHCDHPGFPRLATHPRAGRTGLYGRDGRCCFMVVRLCIRDHECHTRRQTALALSNLYGFVDLAGLLVALFITTGRAPKTTGAVMDHLITDRAAALFGAYVDQRSALALATGAASSALAEHCRE